MAHKRNGHAAKMRRREDADQRTQALAERSPAERLRLIRERCSGFPAGSKEVWKLRRMVEEGL